MMQASTVSPANRDDSHWEEAILSIWSSEGLVHSPHVFGVFFSFPALIIYSLMTINIIILKSVRIMHSNYRSLTTVKIRLCFPPTQTWLPTCCPEMKIYNQCIFNLLTTLLQHCQVTEAKKQFILKSWHHKNNYQYACHCSGSGRTFFLYCHRD